MIDDKMFDALEWEEVDGMKLNELVAGQILTGTEPVDYPATDGVLLYLQDSTGAQTVIEIGQDPYEGFFYIHRAKVPA